MEYLGAKTLKQAITGRRMELGGLLYVAVDLADGLNAAHSKSIVHRDIKPANILVTDGGRGKILDCLGQGEFESRQADALDLTRPPRLDSVQELRLKL